MKKIVLSTVLSLALGTVALTAGSTTFYQDKNGQVFTTAGEDRVAIKSDTPLFSKASKIKLSGTHYLGFNKKSVSGGESTGNFEMRRNYVQVKAYVLNDPQSYLRVTLDAVYDNSHQGDSAVNLKNKKSANNDGHANVYVKYAYLYLDNVLPNTGMEFGMVHRPWIDYEEHQGWWMRSISKVFVEASEASHLTNSADLGFNMKTKTPYFTSELGVFNGEGYHGSNDNTDAHLGDGVSAEWRLTASMLGNGTKKRNPFKDSYFDASFFGQHNMKNSKNAINKKGYDYTWYGVHTVYNKPQYLVSAQYVTSTNEVSSNTNSDSNYNGKGYSVNGTYRFGENKQYSVIGRYDVWEAENEQANETYETQSAIYGVTWQQNKNFKWLLSGQTYKATNGKNYKGSSKPDWTSAMLTAEVHW